MGAVKRNFTGSYTIGDYRIEKFGTRDWRAFLPSSFLSGYRTALWKAGPFSSKREAVKAVYEYHRELGKKVAAAIENNVKEG